MHLCCIDKKASTGGLYGLGSLFRYGLNGLGSYLVHVVCLDQKASTGGLFGLGS